MKISAISYFAFARNLSETDLVMDAWTLPTRKDGRGEWRISPPVDHIHVHFEHCVMSEEDISSVISWSFV